MIINILIIVLCIAADQLTKICAAANLKDISTLPIIENIFHFTYVENRGAAFGMLADNRWVFLILSSLTIICLIVFMFVSKPKCKMERVGLALILAGGIGNMIDRVFLGYVIDFIDFYSIWNYVFNIADSCVCIGVALLILYVIKLSIDEYKASKKAAADEKNADSDSTDGANERTACRAPGRSSTAPSDRPSNHDDDTQ